MQGAPNIRGYEIARLLESSSSVDSWEAVQISLERTVTILTSREESRAAPGEESAFESLARVYARLRHPMFVSVMDIGKSEDGIPYAVLERVEGEQLSAALASGPLQPARAANVAAAICDGLAAAWKQSSVVFRSVKPSNILLCADGSVRFWAFQTIWNSERPGESMARDAGALVGTPSYMAPEQAECSASIDFRADMYAVGAVFYQMLTGRAPFSDVGDALAIVEKQRSGTIPAPSAVRPGVPASYSHVALRLMAKSPSDRYASWDSAIDDLRRIAARRQPAALSGRGAWSPPPSTVEPYAPDVARKTAADAAAGADGGDVETAPEGDVPQDSGESANRNSSRVKMILFAALLALILAGLCRYRIAMLENPASAASPESAGEAVAEVADSLESAASGESSATLSEDAPLVAGSSSTGSGDVAQSAAATRPLHGPSSSYGSGLPAASSGSHQPPAPSAARFGHSGDGASSQSPRQDSSRVTSSASTGYAPYDPVAAASAAMFAEVSRIIRYGTYPKCVSDAKDAIRRVGTRQPALEKKCKALWSQIDGMQPWEDLVGLALAGSPRERVISLEGKEFHIRKPSGYIRPNLLCEVLGGDGQWVSRSLPVNRLSPKEMFSVISALPADRSPQALMSRALLTLREGTTMEFREFVERFDVKPLKPLVARSAK